MQLPTTENYQFVSELELTAAREGGESYSAPDEKLEKEVRHVRPTSHNPNEAFSHHMAGLDHSTEVSYKSRSRPPGGAQTQLCVILKGTHCHTQAARLCIRLGTHLLLLLLTAENKLEIVPNFTFNALQ
jgi:hypothetical protein